MIREIHGVDDARKVASASPETSSTQRVLVTDGDGEIMLSLWTSSYPAGLSPQQARMIAAQLIASAARVKKEPAT